MFVAVYSNIQKLPTCQVFRILYYALFCSVINLIIIDPARSATMFMTSPHGPLDNFNLLDYG